MPEKNILHALIIIRNWGASDDLEKLLLANEHVVSVYHTMGRFSYLVDAHFDNKKQLQVWIKHVKGLTLNGSVPAILNLQTQKIIEVYKQKSGFGLQDYEKVQDALHFFMYIDTHGMSEDLVDFVKKSDIVESMLHIQGEHSFVIEVITNTYDNYKKLLLSMKDIKSVNHVVTQEVIAVLKYRNHIMDASGKYVKASNDTRELFTL